MAGHATVVGQEEVMQAIRNFRPWARACLTRMGPAFEVDLKMSVGRSLVQSHALNSEHCLIYAALLVFIPSENLQMEEAVKTVSNVSTCVHSKEYTTGL